MMVLSHHLSPITFTFHTRGAFVDVMFSLITDNLSHQVSILCNLDGEQKKLLLLFLLCLSSLEPLGNVLFRIYD